MEAMIAQTGVPELSVRRYVDAVVREMDNIPLMRGKQYSIVLIELVKIMNRLEQQGVGIDFTVSCLKDSVEEQLKTNTKIKVSSKTPPHLQLIQETMEAIGRSLQAFLPVLAQVEKLTRDFDAMTKKMESLEHMVQALDKQGSTSPSGGYADKKNETTHRVKKDD